MEVHLTFCFRQNPPPHFFVTPVMKMITLILLLPLSLMLTSHSLFDFSEQTNPYAWRIVDDVVMGGRSDGRFEITEAGHGRFYGKVSLENNGGFSSLRHAFSEPVDVREATHFVLRVKGDGKKYQLRVQSDYRERHSYRAEFTTSGEWETIEIPMADMYPVFRGRELNMANYPAEKIAVFRFLIANGEPEEFSLLIDEIAVR